MIARLLNVHAGVPKNSTAMPSGGCACWSNGNTMASPRVEQRRAIASSEPRLATTPKPARLKRRVTSASNQSRLDRRGARNGSARASAGSCRCRRRSRLPSCRSARSAAARPCRCRYAVDEARRGSRCAPARACVRATASGSAGTRRRAATGARSAPARVARSRLRQRVAEDAAQVVEHDAGDETAAARYSMRPASGDATSRIGSASATADALARSCVIDTRDAGEPMARRASPARWRCSTTCGAPKLSRATEKSARLDLRERRLAREQLDARFLRGEARGQACRTARPVAGVGELLRVKKLRSPRAAFSREQPLDARDLDGVDAAALTAHRRSRAVRFGRALRHAPRRTHDQCGVGAGEAAARRAR